MEDDCKSKHWTWWFITICFASISACCTNLHASLASKRMTCQLTNSNQNSNSTSTEKWNQIPSSKLLSRLWIWIWRQNRKRKWGIKNKSTVIMPWILKNRLLLWPRAAPPPTIILMTARALAIFVADLHLKQITCSCMSTSWRCWSRRAMWPLGNSVTFVTHGRHSQMCPNSVHLCWGVILSYQCYAFPITSTFYQRASRASSKLLRHIINVASKASSSYFDMLST